VQRPIPSTAQKINKNIFLKKEEKLNKNYQQSNIPALRVQ